MAPFSIAWLFRIIDSLKSLWITTSVLGLSDIIVLTIYHDILKVLISRYFVINHCDTMPVHYCH